MKNLKDLTPSDLMDEGRRWVIAPVEFMGESEIPNSIKACAYIQVAARKQAGDALAAFDDDDIGIQTQRERLLGVVERDGYEIIEWYVDEGYSGADPKRPGWFKLLSDAPTAAWTVVLCLNRTRFSRLDSIENSMATQKLRQAGKKIHTAIEGPLDWSDTAGQIIDKMIYAEGRRS